MAINSVPSHEAPYRVAVLSEAGPDRDTIDGLIRTGAVRQATL
jgi:hypothetical protein